jgi:ABC-type sugar transport system ATPase subunit
LALNRQPGGEIELNGQTDRIRRARSGSSITGLGLLTEDRKRTGLCLNLPLSTNITLANVGRAAPDMAGLQAKSELTATTGYIEKLNIRPPFPAMPVGRMSGGNQQKSLLARWLFAGSKVFLLDEPTRGVDVAARSEIYREVNSLAEAGAAIVMVSSDLPELLGNGRPDSDYAPRPARGRAAALAKPRRKRFSNTQRSKRFDIYAGIAQTISAIHQSAGALHPDPAL